ncbi:fumarylacetoacetate hydrolase family protein [Muricoccus radiodurans]|uniref:fumarylacetoacetate hydrolase family protein n=1 Tax=Muricoccus radiodurans TaxID=2231721 RepID=UPI003CF64F7E
MALRGGELLDISAAFPTLSELCAEEDPAVALRGATGPSLGQVGAILANTPPEARDSTQPWMLAPADLQALKAAGVTFVASMLERVIEERAKGAPEAAEAIRAQVTNAIGGNLRALRPGSPEAAEVKALLLEQGMWSQYLEVGIGPDAEIFTKAQPMAAVGTGADVGIRPDSAWNNPEPEVVLACSPSGRVVGATLGNDVNLRDFEGRSALLLSKAKDNNASCALGPFLRLFDAGFSLDDVRRAELSLSVQGPDGFVLEGSSRMSEISRDPAELVAQAMNEHHQYPDGAMLFLGTMFAPTKDRLGPGQGFTHLVGDIVSIASPRLGRLTNRVRHTHDCPPWVHGMGWLMRHLSERGLLGRAAAGVRGAGR